jgi:AcrR family transcriptional regulator
MRAKSGRGGTRSSPARRQTREQTQAETRERLLSAALRLFAEEGYDGASVDRIAAAAGYTKGAFYSNFDGKEAAFLELLGRHMRRESEELSAIFTDAGDGPPPWRALDGWFRKMNADADWAVLAVELGLHARRSPAFAEAYRGLHAEHLAKLASLVATLFRAAGKRPSMRPDQIAAMLKAVAHGLVLERPTLKGRPDPAGAMLATLLRSLIDAAPRDR